MTSDELKLAAEYNRGWQDGKHAKSADEWWLANAREDVVRKLREVKLDGESSHEKLSEICKCIFPADWWTKGACVALREELIGLLGGNDTPSGPLPTFDMLDNERHKAVCELRKINLGFGSLLTNNQICIADAIGVEFNEGDNFSKAMCDRLIHLLGGDDTPSGPKPICGVLSSGRHKAARRLEENKPLLGMTKTEILGDLGKAVTNLPNFDPTDIDHLHMMWSDLIYLLGGDTILKEDDDGMARGDFVRGTVPCDSVGARDVHEETVVDECNFSTLESYTDAGDAEPNPAETSEDASDHVSLNTRITSELRDAIQPCMDDDWLTIERAAFDAIADRIDVQFARICEHQESVLQATIGQMCEERDRLQAAIDLKDRALDATLAKLKDSIELPKDRDGKTWRIGDLILYKGEAVTVDEFVLREDGWTLESDFYSFSFDVNCYIHYPGHTAESIVRDLTLGKISESEAVKRIEELRNE